MSEFFDDFDLDLNNVGRCPSCGFGCICNPCRCNPAPTEIWCTGTCETCDCSNHCSPLPTQGPDCVSFIVNCWFAVGLK